MPGVAELARRVRAARAYAGLSRGELAEKIGMSEATLKRVELGERGLGDLEADTFVHRVAAAANLPAEFLTAPFERLAVPADAGSQLDRLERKVDALLTAVAPEQAAALGDALAGPLEDLTREHDQQRDGPARAHSGPASG